MEIRFTPQALEKLETEGFTGSRHEDDAEKFKDSIARFLRDHPGADVALNQPSAWSNKTIRFILNITERQIWVTDIEVIDPD